MIPEHRCSLPTTDSVVDSYRFEDMNFIKPNNTMSPDKHTRPRTELAITKTHPHVISKNSITLKTF